MLKIKLLDCTLRDGGYYNNWRFNNTLINDYLQTMDKISADYVEIGFRSFDDNTKKGALAYSKDSFLKTLKIPKNICLGVMANASEIIGTNNNPIENTKKLFSKKKKSLVKLIRIASHINEVKNILPSIKILKKFGYIVGVNIMQISSATSKEIKTIVSNLNSVKPDVLYVADSLGSIKPESVKKIISLIKKNWKGNIGFHAHDNQNLAISNIRAAIKEGSNWIDSTVTGMGRGPGNAKTEYIQLLLDNNLKTSSYKSSEIEDLIKKHFLKLKNKYNWGSNIYYYLSGKYGIHPTYIQEMLSDSRYYKKDYYSIIENLKKASAKKYNPSTLRTSNIFYRKIRPSTNWYPSSNFKNKNVLILGSGPSVIKYKNIIERFVNNNKLTVVALNTMQSIDQKKIDFRIISHPQRILTDMSLYNNFKQKIIMPISSIPKQIKKLIKGPKILDYAMTVQEGRFLIKDQYCIIPVSLAIAYALSVLTAGNVKKIYLAGFDGYKANNSNRILNNDVFKLYNNIKPNKKLISITPTKYDLNTKVLK